MVDRRLAPSPRFLSVVVVLFVVRCLFMLLYMYDVMLDIKTGGRG